MEEQEERLGLTDADLVGQQEEGDFPGTTQRKTQQQKAQVMAAAGKPSVESIILKDSSLQKRLETIWQH